RVRKLLHTSVGRLRLEDAQERFPIGVEELAHQHHASWAVIIESGALERIMERFAARARRRDDLSAQALGVLELAQEELASGHADLWPRRLQGVPVPSPGILRGTLDSVCAPGKVLVVGLFEAGELWTSIALRRAVAGLRVFAERVDPIGVVGPSIDRLKRVTDRDVERVLGFHPLELLRRLLSRER